MRLLATLVLVAAVSWTAYNRERIYIRDPIAAVYRNDVRQRGVEVYFNFSNDILLQQNGDLSAQRTILQHWDLKPGTPAGLVCLRWMACLTSADHAPVLPSSSDEKPAVAPAATMKGRHIAFIDADGARISVEL